MAEVILFHQERADGGRRSGLVVDGETVLHGFLPGADEHDPALVWYVDVSLATSAPPTPTNALSWLDHHEDEIRNSLTRVADALNLGIDSYSMPAEFTYPGTDGTVRVTVSAMRHVTGRQIGEKLRQFATAGWAQFFPALTSQG
mgnify:CR=1 FL=1